MTIKTLCVFGTRPEAIKMFPLIKKLERNPQFFNKVCITGQHQQMLEPLLELFKIIPAFNLHVMVENQELSHLMAKILTSLVDVFKLYKPDLVLVHGDTTTAFAAAMSAYYHHTPVVHVEAGLRTGNIYSPWPEEINRKLVGSLSAIHFTPTEHSQQNLLLEGIPEDKIHVTGNTVIDALHETCVLIDKNIQIKDKLKQQFAFLSPERRFILVTGHRRENFGKAFENICRAIALIAETYPNVNIVYPVHLNPNVQHPVKALLKDIKHVFLIDPVDYLAFIYLMKSAYLILTDSGGIQEEAISLGVPVLVMRENTERPEGVVAGGVKLVGTNTDIILQAVEKLLTNEKAYQQMCYAQNPYGDGHASERIVKLLEKQFINKREIVTF